MFRVLKTFLLWLLIAALPIQGAAAVIKASCGPRHHDVSAAMGAEEHRHAPSTAAHSHGAEALAAVGQQLDASDSETQADSSSKLPLNSFCSACAACCAGAVAPPSALSLDPAVFSARASVLPPVVSFVGFIPAGPERPPKHVSA